jgi:hypothetical protein
LLEHLVDDSPVDRGGFGRTLGASMPTRSRARERARDAGERSGRLRDRQAELLLAERPAPTVRVERIRPRRERMIGREVG